MAEDDGVCQIPTPRLPAAELEADLHDVVDRIGHRAFYSQMGHAPRAVKAWMAFYQPLMTDGLLDLRVKELARLRIAELNGCHY